MILYRLKKTKVALFLAIFLGSLSSYINAENYSFASGNTSGLYYPIAGAMSSLWSKKLDNFNMKAEVTGGSLANVIQVAIGEGEVGLAQGNVALDAYYGKGRFPYAMPIEVLFSVYPNAVQLIVRADSNIHSVKDLAGHTVSLGGAGSGTLITAKNILTTLDVDISHINTRYLNYTETANDIRDGRIDAGFIVGGVGVSAIVELATVRDIRLINFTQSELEKINKDNPSYIGFDIAAGTYNRVEQVRVPAVWNVLLANQEMDEEMAYALTKTVFENINKLRQISRVLDVTTPENAYNLAAVPIHPGAARYFKERSTITSSSKSLNLKKKKISE
ncbi:MAG: TAXI family TRAP transporter solute-binding subunit [Gammaproteobacteria bacterium]|nr:TAXI family TRAP transporter solute-binding subunit [Gammaproteobacteria bacterium]